MGSDSNAVQLSPDDLPRRRKPLKDANFIAAPEALRHPNAHNFECRCWFGNSRWRLLLYSSHLALFARAPIPQELPGIKPQFMAIIPVKLDGVLAHRFGGSWLGGGLEHRQRPRGGFLWLARLSMHFPTLLVTQRTGTGIAKISERVVRMMAVFPVNVDASASGEVDFDGFGVGSGHRSVSHRLREVPSTAEASCRNRSNSGKINIYDLSLKLLWSSRWHKFVRSAARNRNLETSSATPTTSPAGVGM